MENYTMFMDWKNQYSENEYTIQSNLQIQCNPYQATNGILHRARKIISQFVWKYKKISNILEFKMTCVALLQSYIILP